MQFDVLGRRQMEQQVGVKSMSVERLQEQLSVSVRSIEKLNRQVMLCCLVCRLIVMVLLCFSWPC